MFEFEIEVDKCHKVVGKISVTFAHVLIGQPDNSLCRIKGEEVCYETEAKLRGRHTPLSLSHTNQGHYSGTKLLFAKSPLSQHKQTTITSTGQKTGLSTTANTTLRLRRHPNLVDSGYK